MDKEFVRKTITLSQFKKDVRRLRRREPVLNRTEAERRVAGQLGFQDVAEAKAVARRNSQQASDKRRTSGHRASPPPQVPTLEELLNVPASPFWSRMDNSEGHYAWSARLPLLLDEEAPQDIPEHVPNALDEVVAFVIAESRPAYGLLIHNTRHYYENGAWNDIRCWMEVLTPAAAWALRQDANPTRKLVEHALKDPKRPVGLDEIRERRTPFWKDAGEDNSLILFEGELPPGELRDEQNRELKSPLSVSLIFHREDHQVGGAWLRFTRAVDAAGQTIEPIREIMAMDPRMALVVLREDDAPEILRSFVPTLNEALVA